MAKSFTNSEFEDILIYFTNSIFGQNTEEEIAWDLARNCISKLDFEDCVVYFVDEAKGLLEQKAAYGPKNPREFDIADPILIPVGEGITGWVAKNAQSELILDTSIDKRYIVDDKHRLSEISVPVIVDDKVFAVIDCEHSHKNFFTRQHLKILEAIALICAVKISKVRAERSVREKEMHLLEVQRELLALKTKALRTQMNPHFLFNATNAIQYFITIGDRSSALRYLSTLSRLIRYYLNNFEKDFVGIGEELQWMRYYLDLQKMRYADKFEYNLISRVKSYELALKIPGLVLGSFAEHILENAVFDNTSIAKIKIKCWLKNEHLLVSAIFSRRKEKNPERQFNYRDHLGSWEEQMDMLNRLKGLAMIREQQIREMGTAGLYVQKILISLPIIE